MIVATLVLFAWKRSNKRRIRCLSFRAVTPLDDAEFESWRRPSQHTKTTEKDGLTLMSPIVVRSPKISRELEKELNLYEFPRRASTPRDTPLGPTSPIPRPDPVRRKESSASSLADRPPTPYSPTTTNGEFPRRGSQLSRKSGSTPHGHYASLSDTSTFEFGFGGSDYGISPPQGNSSRPSMQGDRRPLNQSYARFGERG